MTNDKKIAETAIRAAYDALRIIGAYHDHETDLEYYCDARGHYWKAKSIISRLSPDSDLHERLANLQIELRKASRRSIARFYPEYSDIDG